MIRHSVVRATPELVEQVFDNLREDARAEIGGFSKEVLMRRIFEKSMSFVGLVEQTPICAYGIREAGVLEPAEVWLVSTPLIETFALRFLRENRKFMDWAVGQYGVLGGFVQVGNVRSQRWLRWLGFELKPEAEHSLLGRVYPFERRLF